MLESLRRFPVLECLWLFFCFLLMVHLHDLLAGYDALTEAGSLVLVATRLADVDNLFEFRARDNAIGRVDRRRLFLEQFTVVGECAVVTKPASSLAIVPTDLPSVDFSDVVQFWCEFDVLLQRALLCFFSLLKRIGEHRCSGRMIR